MKKKKRRDSTPAMIALTAAIGVAAIALVVTGIVFLLNGRNVDTYDPADTSAVPETSAPQTMTGTSASKQSIKLSDEGIVLITASDTVSQTEETAPVTEQITVSEETTTEAVTSAQETTAEQTTVEQTTAAQTTAEQTTVAQTTTEQTTAAETTAAETTAAASGSYDKSFFANDLFIGDSIYTGLYLYDYFPQKQVFAKVGLNPTSALTAEISGSTAAGRAGSMQPTHIFIMLGTNGLAYMSASGMADNMKTLVADLKAASPSSSVYIVSIPPVTYEHELKGQETMAMVNKYNDLLKSAAGECGATYLNLCAELQSSSGYFSSAYAEADGLHFLGSAYKKMLSFFQSSVS